MPKDKKTTISVRLVVLKVLEHRRSLSILSPPTDIVLALTQTSPTSIPTLSPHSSPVSILYETDIQEQDKKKAKNKQIQAQNGKDKVKPKPKSENQPRQMILRVYQFVAPSPAPTHVTPSPAPSPVTPSPAPSPAPTAPTTAPSTPEDTPDADAAPQEAPEAAKSHAKQLETTFWATLMIVLFYVM
ncbi:hypothetical protein Tco_0885418 [Tanacetum coccineum]